MRGRVGPQVNLSCTTVCRFMIYIACFCFGIRSELPQYESERAVDDKNLCNERIDDCARVGLLEIVSHIAVEHCGDTGKQQDADNPEEFALVLPQEKKN